MMWRKIQTILLITALTVQNPAACCMVYASESETENNYIEALEDIEEDNECQETESDWEESEDDYFWKEEETEGLEDDECPEWTETESGLELEIEVETEMEAEVEIEIETETEEMEFWEDDDFEEEGFEDDLDEEFEEETDEESDSEEDASAFDIYSPGGKEMSGLNIASADGWQEIGNLSSDYTPMRFYPGISSFEIFNYSDNVIISESGLNRRYLYPVCEGQEGTFGGIYHNVLYQKGRWYDLRMTVDAYSSAVSSLEGESVGGFPYIGFSESGIGWTSHGMLGELILRCEICDAETGIPVCVKTRLQWEDIDGAQRYGIRTIDGKISGKYYYPGSELHVQDNQTVCGVNGMGIVLGPECNAPEDATEYTVCYELDGCSSYYLAFALRDHLGESGYTLRRKELEEAFRMLADGEYDLASPGNENLIQTENAGEENEIPSPVGKVSKDKSQWYEEVKLEKVSDHFWYKTVQYIPYQNELYAYADLRIKDVLPKGLSYIGNISVVREEDGKDVSDWFVISENNQVLVASAKREVLQENEFYGSHYALQFELMMKTEELVPEIYENAMRYCAVNQTTTQYRQCEEEEFCLKDGNEVMVIAETEKKEPEAPKAGIDGDLSLTKKKIDRKDEEIVFTISQNLPEYTEGTAPDLVELMNMTEACYTVKEIAAEARKKESELFYPVSLHKTETENGQAVWDYSPEYAGGELRFQVHCMIKADADLSFYQKEADQGTATEIPETAAVIFHWENEKEEPVTKRTNKVLICYQENRIVITKEIEADDIVWEHGNPTFIFRIYGEDKKGTRQEFYRVISFKKEDLEKENLDSKDSDKALLTKKVEIAVLDGNYTVTEQPVIRYRANMITDVVNGSTEGAKVSFDLTEQHFGSAVFYSEKFTDEFTSDNVCNVDIIG